MEQISQFFVPHFSICQKGIISITDQEDCELAGSCFYVLLEQEFCRATWKESQDQE